MKPQDSSAAPSNPASEGISLTPREPNCLATLIH